MNRKELLTPNLPDYVTRKSVAISLAGIFALSLLPWIAFTSGAGRVTAIDPNERIQSLTAPVNGFIQRWHVKEGDVVKQGQNIADLIDNDPSFVERLERERDAASSAVQSARLMMDTAQLNLNRQRNLFEQGLASRKDYEKAKIVQSKNAFEYAKAQATLVKAEVQLSRQATQHVQAPRNGTIVRILPGEGNQLVKAGTPIAVFAPEVKTPAVELWVEGIDAALIRQGQSARVQFEGWPSLQIPGWPALAINTFPARVHVVDQASSTRDGKFRVLLVPSGTWPSDRILRLGNQSRGFIKLADSYILREIWRQLNAFPPTSSLIKDELQKLLAPEKDKEDDEKKDKEKEKEKEAEK